jgi:hypothetical protein
MKITYKVIKGKNANNLFEPHKHKNGKFAVSKTRFVADYIYVNTYEEIITHLNKGYKVRMSDPITHESPSLIKKESLVLTKT